MAASILTLMGNNFRSNVEKFAKYGSNIFYRSQKLKPVAAISTAQPSNGAHSIPVDPSLPSQSINLDALPNASHRSPVSRLSSHQLAAASRVDGQDDGTTQRWQLMSAACVERAPIITQEMNILEKEFAQLMAATEFENSVMSDHELRVIEQKKLAQKKSKDDNDDDNAELARTTVIEIEDGWEEELKNFKPANRVTEADVTKDLRSCDRRLDSKLVLLVNQKLSNTDKTHWVLPMGYRQEGESMRQAAETILANLCGTELKAVFVGNAPCSFYKFHYPPALQKTTGFTGAKVFFFRAQYCNGSVALNKKGNVSDFMWLHSDELKDYLMPIYRRKVEKFIKEL